MATDAITGFVEGITSGFERGTTLRRQRTFDQQQAEELQRQRIAEQIEAGRQAVLDQQNADRAARESAEFQLETGLAPGTQPVGARPTGVAPPGLPGVPQEIMDLRAGVAQEIAPTAQVPAGFRRVGPSVGERETERVQGLRADVGRFMGATPEERTELLRDPAVIGALEELGQLGDVFERRTAGPAPSEARFGVTPEGGRSIAGATEAEATEFRGELESAGLVDRQFIADQTNALADDFFREATTSIDVAAAVTRFRAAGDNAIGDQTRIIALNKLLDPGSIVREGEFNRVGQAGDLTDRAQFFFNRIGADGRLPSELSTSLDAEIEAQAAAAEAQFALTVERFRVRGEALGINAIELGIVFNPFAPFDVGGDISPPVVDAEEDAFMDGLVTQGLSNQEMDARLREFRRGR